MIYLAEFEGPEATMLQGAARFRSPPPGAPMRLLWWRAFQEILDRFGGGFHHSFAWRLVFHGASVEHVLLLCAGAEEAGAVRAKLLAFDPLNAMVPGSLALPATRHDFDALTGGAPPYACHFAATGYTAGDGWLSCRFHVRHCLENLLAASRAGLTFPVWYQVNFWWPAQRGEILRQARKNLVRLEETPGLPGKLLERQVLLAQALEGPMAVGEEFLAVPDEASARALAEALPDFFARAEGQFHFEAPPLNFMPEAFQEQLALGLHRGVFSELSAEEVCAECLGERDLRAFLLSEPDARFHTPISPVMAAAAASAPTASGQPGLRIVQPVDGAALGGSQTLVQVEVTADPAALAKLQISFSINGRPVAQSRDIGTAPVAEPAGIQRASMSVGLQPGRNIITVAARAEGREWPAASITVHCLAMQMPAVLYALCIGVSRYRAAQVKSLTGAAGDACRLGEAFRTCCPKLFRDVQVRLLLDQEASRERILEELEWLEQSAHPDDLVVLSVSGHGTRDRSGDYYFLPHDFEAQRLRHTGVLWMDFHKTVRSLPGRVLFLVDSCHAGSSAGDLQLRQVTPPPVFGGDLCPPQSGVVVMAAATGNESALESPEWGGGAFTTALVEGLSGKADVMSGDGIVHLKELDAYVTMRVKALTDGRQHATTQVPINLIDFPVSMP